MVREDSYTERVVAEWIDVDRDGSALPCYYAAPKDAKADTPSIVLAMHLTGVDAQYRDCARRFAAEGFATIAPNFYSQFDAPDGDVETDYQKFMPFAYKLNFKVVEPDIRAAAGQLRAMHPQTKICMAGFCMGGGIAAQRSHGHRDLFTAAAMWYGRVSNIDPATVDIPLVGSFGGADTTIPLESVHAFAAGLTGPHDVKIYDGAGHAFCDQTGPTYDREAAEDSWRRALAFLRTAVG